jgi:hypothetical protein
MNSYFLTLLTAFLLVGCSSKAHLAQRSGNLDLQVKSRLQADIEVDMQKKIVGRSYHSSVFGIDIKSSRNYADGVTYGDQKGKSGFLFFGPGIVEEAKSAAAYNATVPNKADVLVAPQYHVKVNSWFFGLYKEVHAQVWGYAGKIRNISNP